MNIQIPNAAALQSSTNTVPPGNEANVYTRFCITNNVHHNAPASPHPRARKLYGNISGKKIHTIGPRLQDIAAADTSWEKFKFAVAFFSTGNGMEGGVVVENNHPWKLTPSPTVRENADTTAMEAREIREIAFRFPGVSRKNDNGTKAMD
mmetsp:Transcript_14684/g.20398  ORF Transcript_14684/g.20398 Transcript_14684/m.20398 type:complete len:150 (+) Transcript_14684:353-802(+)